MKRRGLVTPAAIGAGVLAVVAVLLIFRPENTVSAAIVAGAATVMAAAFTVAVGRYFEQERAFAEQARQKKIPVYEDFKEGDSGVD